MRSQLLMSVADTALMVVDVQERLLPAIAENHGVLARCLLLVRGARVLGMRILATEQYPKGLGRTTPSLAELLDEPIEKLAFSCCGEAAVVRRLGDWGVDKVLLCGIESHVCVQQTALDLLAHGFRVYIAADAVGSRRAADREWALQRLVAAGVIVTTAEAALFEWTEVAGSAQFKEISTLVKEASDA